MNLRAEDIGASLDDLQGYVDPNIPDMVRISSDDRDINTNELCITFGGNGDYYICVAPKGEYHVQGGVRISMSGGMISRHRDFALGVAKMWQHIQKRAKEKSKP